MKEKLSFEMFIILPRRIRNKIIQNVYNKFKYIFKITIEVGNTINVKIRIGLFFLINGTLESP